MGWINWNSDPRDDENETEIRCVLVCGSAVFILIMLVVISVIKDIHG